MGLANRTIIGQRPNHGRIVRLEAFHQGCAAVYFQNVELSGQLQAQVLGLAAIECDGRTRLKLGFPMADPVSADIESLPGSMITCAPLSTWTEPNCPRLYPPIEQLPWRPQGQGPVSQAM